MASQPRKPSLKKLKNASSLVLTESEDEDEMEEVGRYRKSLRPFGHLNCSQRSAQAVLGEACPEKEVQKRKILMQ